MNDAQHRRAADGDRPQRRVRRARRRPRPRSTTQGRPEPARANVLDDRDDEARDPQTALEAAKAEGRPSNAGGTGARDAAKRKEMAASGIDPDSMSFEQYRTWLNDFWLQKITNTLHDKYCLKGLEVASPDKPERSSRSTATPT